MLTRQDPAWFEVTGEAAAALARVLRTEASGSPAGVSPSGACPDTPGSFAEAIKYPEWRESIRKELEGFKGKVEVVNKQVTLARGKKIHQVRYVFKTKRDKKGDVIKRKTRLVVKDIKFQTRDTDIANYYSHVTRMDSVRTLIAISVQPFEHCENYLLTMKY